MYQLPFQQPGRFYRGNLHTHSTRSDGALAPEVVVDAYRSHSYDFVALTVIDNFGKRAWSNPTWLTSDLASSDQVRR